MKPRRDSDTLGPALWRESPTPGRYAIDLVSPRSACHDGDRLGAGNRNYHAGAIHRHDLHRCVHDVATTTTVPETASRPADSTRHALLLLCGMLDRTIIVCIGMSVLSVGLLCYAISAIRRYLSRLSVALSPTGLVPTNATLLRRVWRSLVHQALSV
jgi:hypothetical protein